MGYFAYPYLVTFDDTMAYGTHHFMTNFKFQCAARESLLFGNIMDKQEDWRDELKDIIMLTRDGYTRNMNPVPVGEKVTVFMSFEEPSLSSMRLCFRTIGSNGEPIACGYQSIVCVDSKGTGLVELPKSFTQFREYVEEKCQEPMFDERARKGGKLAEELFTPKLAEFSKWFTSAISRESYPKIVNFDD